MSIGWSSKSRKAIERWTNLRTPLSKTKHWTKRYAQFCLYHQNVADHWSVIIVHTLKSETPVGILPHAFLFRNIFQFVEGHWGFKTDTPV